MSLREDLKEILENTDIPDTDEQLNTLVGQLLETISKHLPEKKEFVDERGFYDDKTKLALINNFKGYNQALTDVNKLLTTNKEGKV